MVLGLGLTSGIVRLDVQGRALAVHSADGYGERGAGLTLALGGRKREGLSLSVVAELGGRSVGERRAVARGDLPPLPSEKVDDAFAVDAREDYGMRLPNGGLLTWFGRYSHSPYGRSFVVAGSIGGLADALLYGPDPCARCRVSAGRGGCDSEPLLYLRGLSTGDFQEALPGLPGEEAAGPSPTTISR